MTIPNKCVHLQVKNVVLTDKTLMSTQKLTPYYITIDLKTFSIELFSLKVQVAEHIKCHPNSLPKIDDKIVFGDYLIIARKVTNPQKREKKKDKEYGI